MATLGRHEACLAPMIICGFVGHLLAYKDASERAKGRPGLEPASFITNKPRTFVLLKRRKYSHFIFPNLLWHSLGNYFYVRLCVNRIGERGRIR